MGVVEAALKTVGGKAACQPIAEVEEVASTQEDLPLTFEEVAFQDLDLPEAAVAASCLVVVLA